MRGVLALYQSTIGKKVVMAVTGLMLVGFILGHMAGNLKIYQGAEKYDAYAAGLRELGKPLLGHYQAIWLARLGLLAAVGLHIWSALSLTSASRKARGTGYKKFDDVSMSYASRTMRWGGVILLAFIVYHLLHLTVGTVHREFEYGAVYQNVVLAFQRWPVSVVYIVANLALAMHLYHGIWSMTQTLSLTNNTILRVRRPLAAGIALVVLAGNISIPLSVMLGVISL
ncbi:hypothetical protein ABI59_06470 [Acidobacteria bacterium Mor1]|nr:hypothetical protein ABI59_06470 [Acidobacteria bacterium Mor1]